MKANYAKFLRSRLEPGTLSKKANSLAIMSLHCPFLNRIMSFYFQQSSEIQLGSFYSWQSGNLLGHHLDFLRSLFRRVEPALLDGHSSCYIPRGTPCIARNPKYYGEYHVHNWAEYLRPMIYKKLAHFFSVDLTNFYVPLTPCVLQFHFTDCISCKMFTQFVEPLEDRNKKTHV